uniref:MFS domain-containing protein n=1 Tax=Strongyloides venezuelensis TaxID=75913 RepID=A0A0K0F804_STRVS
MVKKLDNKEKNGTFYYMENATAWTSIHVVCLLAFSSAVQFTLYFSSTNQYLKSFDPNTTEFFYGLVISSYSFGNVIFSPIMGYLSNKLKQIKLLLYVGLICQFVGNLIYFYVEILPFDKKFFLLIGRFITGIGASNVSLMKAYISGASLPEDRSRCIAYITGTMAVGAFCGPALQLIFVHLGHPGINILNLFRIHMFNAPALAACLFVIINFFFVFFFFKEIYVDILETSNDSYLPLPPYNVKSILICYLTRFCQTFISTNLETLAAVISMSVFSFTALESVNVISLANTGRAIIALLISLLYVFVKIENYVSLRNTIIICTFWMILFHIITYPYGLYKNVLIYNSTITSFNNTSVGCNILRHSWCNSLTPCNPYLYYITHTIIIGSTYSAVNICLNTLFSKIIGPRRQAFEQGTLNMSKGISQMISPPFIGYIFDYAGLKAVWIIHISFLSGAIMLWVIYYKKMVPFKLFNEKNDIFSIELSNSNISQHTEKSIHSGSFLTTSQNILKN